jgi:hypothetical protein
MKWLNYAMGYSDGPCQDAFGIGSGIQAGTQLAAAGLQSRAINKATEAQQQAAQQQLGFQRDVFNTQQQNLQPSLQAGQFGLSNLQAGLSNGLFGQMFSTGVQPQNVTPDGVDANAFGAPNPNFNAPNTMTSQFDPNSIDPTKDPGYQFRMDQGMKALQRSQSSTGITGGAAAKAIAEYSQGLASQEYGNTYGRALQASQQNLGINQANFGQAAQTYGLNSGNRQQQIQNAFTATGQNNQARLQAAQLNNQNQLSRYNAQTEDVSNLFNRFASLAGIGQTGVGQLIGAGNAASQGMAQGYAGLGNANSAGSAAQGNVWGNLATGLGNTYQQYQMMRSMGMGGQGGVRGTPPFVDQGDYPWSSLTG